MTTRYETYVSTATMGLDADIRRACGYMPPEKDGIIAAYYGVKIERVRMERAQITAPRPIGTARKGCGNAGPPMLGQASAWRSAAEKANAEFLAAHQRYLANREAKMRRAG